MMTIAHNLLIRVHFLGAALCANMLLFQLISSGGQLISLASAETQYTYTYFELSSAVTQVQAEAYCNGKGGWLGTIRHSEDATQLQEKYGSSPRWTNLITGGSDELAPDTWRWKYGPPEIKGSLMTYSNWNAGEPNNYGGSEDAMSLAGYGYNWNDISQHTTFTSVLCQFIANTPATRYFYTYYEVSPTANQAEAETYCNGRGGWLGTIRSAEDNAQLQKQYGSSPPWGGLVTGGSDELAAGTWRWKYGPPEIQESVFYYYTWNTNEPNNNGGNEDALGMTAEYLWYDYPRTSAGSSILCQFVVTPTATSTSTLSKTTIATSSASLTPTASVTQSYSAITSSSSRTHLGTITNNSTVSWSRSQIASGTATRHSATPQKGDDSSLASSVPSTFNMPSSAMSSSAASSSPSSSAFSAATLQESSDHSTMVFASTSTAAAPTSAVAESIQVNSASSPQQSSSTYESSSRATSSNSSGVITTPHSSGSDHSPVAFASSSSSIAAAVGSSLPSGSTAGQSRSENQNQHSSVDQSLKSSSHRSTAADSSHSSTSSTLNNSAGTASRDSSLQSIASFASSSSSTDAAAELSSTAAASSGSHMVLSQSRGGFSSSSVGGGWTTKDGPPLELSIDATQLQKPQSQQQLFLILQFQLPSHLLSDDRGSTARAAAGVQGLNSSSQYTMRAQSPKYDGQPNPLGFNNVYTVGATANLTQLNASWFEVTFATNVGYQIEEDEKIDIILKPFFFEPPHPSPHDITVTTVSVIATPDSATVFTNGASGVIGVAAAALMSAPAALDAQSLAVLGMLSCAQPNSRAAMLNKRLLSPLPIGSSDTYEGMILGNLVLAAAFVILHGSAVCILKSVQKLDSWSEAQAAAYWPSFSWQFLFLLYQGTATASIKIMQAPDSEEVDSLLLAISGIILTIPLLPLATIVLVQRNVTSTFHRYDYNGDGGVTLEKVIVMVDPTHVPCPATEEANDGQQEQQQSALRGAPAGHTSTIVPQEEVEADPSARVVPSSANSNAKQFRMIERADGSMARVPYFPPWVSRFFLPTGKWLSGQVRHRYGCLYGHLHRYEKFWCTCSTWSPSLLILAIAIRPSTAQGCTWLFAVLASFEFVIAALILVFQPFRSIPTNTLSGTSNVCLGIVLVGLTLQAQDPASSSAFMLTLHGIQAQLAVICVRVVWTVVQFAVERLVLCRVPIVPQLITGVWVGSREGQSKETTDGGGEGGRSGGSHVDLDNVEMSLTVGLLTDTPTLVSVRGEMEEPLNGIRHSHTSGSALLTESVLLPLPAPDVIILGEQDSQGGEEEGSSVGSVDLFL